MSRPWYRKKRYLIPLILLAVVVVASAVGGGSKKDTSTTSSDQNRRSPSAAFTKSTGQAPGGRLAAKRLYPGRPDAQAKDHEVRVGGSASFSGYTVTVTSAGYQRRLNDFSTAGYLLAAVSVTNRDAAAQPYNMLDWRLQTPSGTVLDPDFGAPQELGSGDLVSGGTVKGKIAFAVGREAHGQYYLLYKPDPFDSSRGIWGVRL